MAETTQLLLHLGFPKTATTTLQEDVFLPLHRAGKINYLGRTTTSTHTRSGRSAFDGQDWAVQLRRHLVLDEPLHLDRSLLAKDKLNVLSDEDLTLHPLFNEAQFGVHRGTFDFADKLRKILGGEVEIRFLLTIRNQADLIFSGFKQKYRFLSHLCPNLSFRDFLLNRQGEVDADRMRYYDFGIVLDRFHEALKAEVTILLYEDLKHRPEDFTKVLADELQLPAVAISKLLAGKHRRQQPRLAAGFPIRSPQLRTVFAGLDVLLPGKHSFYYFLMKRYHMRFSWWLKMEKKLFLKHKTLHLPHLTEQERQTIRKHFRERNRVFASEWELNTDRMQAYGYF